MKKLKVLIADDHAILRIGLSALIGSDKAFTVVGEAEDGADAIRKAAELKPDLIVMDLMMPGVDGVEAIDEILGKRSELRGPRSEVNAVVDPRALRPGPTVVGGDPRAPREGDQPKILVLTTFASSDQIARAMKAGAKGALLKSSASTECLTALHALAEGGSYVSNEVRELLAVEPPVAMFTARQQEVLDALVRGLTNEDIGKMLGISADRVKQHLSVIYQKLGVENRAEAIAAAVRRNLITPVH